jgi:pyruvate,water dikinase
MHWPHGISLLAATMDMPAFGRGALKAVQELCMPIKGFEFKHVRGYVYNGIEPWSYDPAEMEARMQQMQAQMMKHVPGLYERWRNVYEPEVRAINDETLHGDYGKLGDGDLSALLEQLIAKREREGELHFLAVFPAMGAVMGFEEVYTQLFGAPKAGEHLQLLQGFENKSTETDTALWRLAMEARSRPAVLEVLRAADPSRAHAELAANDETRSYHDAVEEFLDNHGVHDVEGRPHDGVQADPRVRLPRRLQP